LHPGEVLCLFVIAAAVLTLACASFKSFAVIVVLAVVVKIEPFGTKFVKPITFLYCSVEVRSPAARTSS
jgi:hypothetical protein